MSRWAYHGTRAALSEIAERGLEPRVPSDVQLYGRKPILFLFSSAGPAQAWAGKRGHLLRFPMPADAWSDARAGDDADLTQWLSVRPVAPQHLEVRSGPGAWIPVQEAVMSHKNPERSTEDSFLRAMGVARQQIASADLDAASNTLYRAKVLLEVMSESNARMSDMGEPVGFDAGTLAKYEVNYNLLMRKLTGKGRRNPEPPNDPDLVEAVAGYEDFHAWEPREIGKLAITIPKTVCVVGEAKRTLYRSDKWENKSNDYYHDHDPGVNVGRCDTQEGRMVDVPAFIANTKAVYLLGQCLGFSYTQPDGETIEAEVGRPLPELYAVPNRKGLLVIDTVGKRAQVVAVIWGGNMVVKDVGIVG